MTVPRDDSSIHPRSPDGHAAGLRLSPVSVRARAVIPFEGGIAVSRDRHRGRLRLTLPGGRVKPGESAAGCVVREVHEETGLQIALGRLLYVCEVVSSSQRQDLNLIFLGQVVRKAELPVAVVHPEGGAEILPPILDRIRCDQAGGWARTGIWLGNVWQPDSIQE